MILRQWRWFFVNTDYLTAKMPDFDFQWNGDPVQQEVFDALHKVMAGLGGFLTDGMRAIVPVGETGNLKASIADSYDPSTFTLTIIVGMPYTVYVEFGTRNQDPQPFIRPVIYDAAARYGWIDWSVLLTINPPVLNPTHLRATTGGFRIPKGTKLTAKQLHRVQTKLRPTSRKFAQKFRRRKIGFSVLGPK
jgi:HK97 gp10 family phage protein